MSKYKSSSPIILVYALMTQCVMNVVEECKVVMCHIPGTFLHGWEKYLYWKLVKAVYRTILETVLFYNKVYKQLEDQGFEKNHYNECTWNNTVDDEDVTVQVQVDGLIAGHKDQCILNNYIKEFNGVLGCGTLLSLFGKQKLVTKSSTEAELVGVDDTMTFVMWTQYFFSRAYKEFTGHIKVEGSLKP